MFGLMTMAFAATALQALEPAPVELSQEQIVMLASLPAINSVDPLKLCSEQIAWYACVITATNPDDCGEAPGCD